jgi:DNA-binding transcriptional ArsR family regulator
MAKPDEIIHQSLRLRIMAALHAGRDGEPIEFGRLKALTEATDGNLGSHLATLEGAGYVTLAKDFLGKKPRTRAAITRAGADAFREHTAYLRELIEAAAGE